MYKNLSQTGDCVEAFCRATREMGLPGNDSLLLVEHMAYILDKLRPHIRAIMHYNKGYGSVQLVVGR
jgi:hypothetical protein